MDLRIEDISDGVIEKFTNIVNKETDNCIMFPCREGVYRYPLQCVTSKRLGQKSIPAHRVSYVIFNGDLEEGDVVMHTCDNPHCVNPKHLVKGTLADNNRDRANKGRTEKQHIVNFAVKGQKARRAKGGVEFSTISEIRRLREEEHLSYRKLANMFGFAKSYIMDVCNFKCRKNE